MGNLIRNYDWAQTVLGRPDDWPQSLCCYLNLLLNSKFPMLLFWGSDLINFYNDAFRPSLGNNGKHPAILGLPAQEAWSEVWNFTGPLVESILKGGEAVWYEDQLVPIYRNGQLEDVYWTFSYSPVMNDEGFRAGVMVTCTETTKSVQGIQRLQESEGRFQDLVRGASTAIVVLTGPEMKVEIVNEAYGRLIDRTPAELLNRPLFDVVPEAREQYLPLLEQVLQTSEPVYLHESPYTITSNGKRIEGFLHVVYQPYRNVAGQTIGVMAILQDVTQQVMARQRIEEVVAQRTKELAEANEALKNINKELFRSNSQLEDFAYAASHDLKEPVRKIHVFTTRLKEQLETHLTEEQVQTFSRINSATERMGMLIDDLLLYSHVSQRPHEMETIDLNLKVQRVLEDLELAIQEKSALVEVGPLPVVQGYRRQMQQLFQNLISNALKYSKTDTRPQIRITARPMEIDNCSYHLIEVADNGIGFEEEYADKIFQMFTRLHGRHEYSGTGVGLSIVKRIMENHGGFIKAESRKGVGSVFKVYLPV